MITRIGSVSIFVTDQDRSRDFFVNKVGFELQMDEPMGLSRWIEVAPKDAQTSLVLQMPTEDMPPEVRERAKSLIGSFTNFIFEVDDMQVSYDELSARGVEFRDKPSQQPWGWWATIKDPDGNVIGLHK